MVTRKKSEGLESLIPPEAPVSIQEITMLDWYAAFALMSSDHPDPEQQAKKAFEIANAMMKERKSYPT